MAEDTMQTSDATTTSGTPTLGSLKDEATKLFSTGKDAARTAASTGKDRAAAALDDVARVIEDAARTLDDKVGSQVGDYVRRASSGVSDLSTSLQGKDLDELFDEAKNLVRANPAIAVGAAAAVGFVLTRLFKLGTDDLDDRD